MLSAVISARHRYRALPLAEQPVHERKNWDGPQPAIEKLDLNADKAVRISGKDDYVWEPFWLSTNEFLCIMQKENENQASIYRMSLDGKNPRLIVKHARTPTASAP